MAAVLLVDGDVFVCAVLKLCLQADGHEVVCASTADMARRILTGSRPIDLVIADLNLPGGEDAVIGLALAARTARTRIPVLFTSAMGLSDAARLLPGSAYLPKPFGPDLLQHEVRRLLGSRVDDPPTGITPPVRPRPLRSC